MRPEAGDYLFAHALIQEGVYSSLLHSRKRELHARRQNGTASRSRSCVPSTWIAPRIRVRRTRHLVGAQEEAHRFRYDTALRLAQRGSELAQDGELRYAMAMLRGELLRELARTEESITAFERGAAPRP